MTEKHHYRVIYKVIMDNMESKEQALSEAVKSIRQNINGEEFETYLKLIEIPDERFQDLSDRGELSLI